MKLIGLTGGIASGKSTVSKMLRALGASVIDADAVYHDLLAPRDDGAPSDTARAIAARFPGVLRADGTIDRKLLGERVFDDAAAREALNGITHPRVALETARRLGELQTSHVVYDVPLLYERGLEAGMQGVIVVWVPRDVQLARLVQRDALSRDAAEKRLAAQMPLDDKRAMATWVIDNSGSVDETRRRVEDLWRNIVRDAS
jgi:dephospho-CoA kinase